MPLWSRLSPNRPLTVLNERVDLSIVDVNAVDEEPYFIRSNFPDPVLGASGGYAFSVFGHTDGLYHREGVEVLVPGYRVHLKIDSDPDRYGFTAGALGGGTLHDKYAEVGLSLHHDYVRDVLFELRRDPIRELRVAGPATAANTFRVDMFMLSPSKS